MYFRLSASGLNKRIFRRAVMLAAVIITAGLVRTTLLYASTLSSNYAEVVIEDLRIGGTYNLSEVANLPMWVTYQGGDEITVEVTAVLPRKDELKPEYEAVPDLSWIKLSNSRSKLLPGESFTTDVIISVPDDEKYLGKKYQVYLLARSIPTTKEGVSIALAVKGRIMMTVASKPLTKEEMKKMKRAQRMEAYAPKGIIMSPEKVYLEGVVPGKRTTVADLMGREFKLINTSSEKMEVAMTVVDPRKNGISLPWGYEVCDNLNAVKIKKTKVTIKEDSVIKVPISINLPKDENSMGKKYLFAVKIDIKSKTREIAQFMKIYITTENTEEIQK